MRVAIIILILVVFEHYGIFPNETEFFCVITFGLATAFIQDIKEILR